MNAATWIEDGRFLKRYPSPEAADRALERSRLAREAGAPTPDARATPRAGHVSFSIVAGTMGSTLAAAGRIDLLLPPLRPLRSMKQDGLGRLDPFARIDLRLAIGPDWLPARIEGLRTRPWPATGVVHGDFHPGQVIRDQTGLVWLVDLDDLALGPVEADLGNLVAHLATAASTAGGDLSGSLAGWTARVAGAWRRIHSAPDRSLLEHFRTIAVVRRALKLAENGRPWVLHQLPNILSGP